MLCGRVLSATPPVKRLINESIPAIRCTKGTYPSIAIDKGFATQDIDEGVEYTVSGIFAMSGCPAIQQTDSANRRNDPIDMQLWNQFGCCKSVEYHPTGLPLIYTRTKWRYGLTFTQSQARMFLSAFFDSGFV